MAGERVRGAIRRAPRRISSDINKEFRDLDTGERYGWIHEGGTSRTEALGGGYNIRRRGKKAAHIIMGSYFFFFDGMKALTD